MLESPPTQRHSQTLEKVPRLISDSEKLEKFGPDIGEDVCLKTVTRVTCRHLSSSAAQKKNQ